MVFGPMILSLMLLITSLIHGWQVHPQVESVELRTGYAFANNNEDQPTGFQTTPLLPSVAVPLTEPIGSGWYRGRIEWNPELFFGVFSYPYVRPLFGVAPLQFRYALETGSRWTPYLFGSMGVVHSKVERQETGSDFNFLLSAGLGAQYALTEHTALLLEYRHIHISNANIDDNNSAIDSHAFLVGVSFKR